jgi:two-component sensor histidine kinase
MGPGKDLMALRKDGRQFPVEIGLSSIDTAEGRATLAAIFDITERREQQALAERSLAEKETLLKEVYHRVKNNLQVVQSLLNLQRQGLPPGEARTAMDESVQRIRAMALVHEKLYQSGNLTAISLPNYTRDLIRQLSDAHGIRARNVQVHTDIPDIQTGLDSAVPLGLLLTELISNCLKHAFVDRAEGEVRISVVPQKNGALLTVADNGVGMSAPSAGAGQGSMGLKLAASLAQQLGGELSWRVEQGTVFSTLLTRL